MIHCDLFLSQLITEDHLTEDVLDGKIRFFHGGGVSLLVDTGSGRLYGQKVVVDTVTHRVLTRSFPTMQWLVPLEDDTPVEVSEKIDGVLGLLYPKPDEPTGWGVVTPGGFADPISVYATELFQTECANWNPRHGFSYLFEIVSEKTTHFVNYGTDEDLYLISILNTYTGDIISVRHPHVTVPRTRTYPYPTYSDFRSNYKPVAGSEGVVLRDLSTGVLYKCQSEEYLELKDAK